MIFMYVNETEYSQADVGSTKTGGASPIDRRVGSHFVHRECDEMTELEYNLNRLTLDIQNILVDDLPRTYQRHTMGVSGHFGCFLCRVARTIMCYHEHH